MNQSDLLKEILSPLLADFHYWFDRSQQLLEQESLSFMTTDEQNALLQRVTEAQAELNVAETLYKLSDNEVGIDPGLVSKWHGLLMECAEIGHRYRQLRRSSDA